MNKEEYEKELLKKIVNSIKNKDKDQLIQSIIITGSFGRNEPTYYQDRGKLILKSDVEIGIIRKSNYNNKKFVNLLHSVREEFKEEINFIPLSIKRVRKIYNYNNSIIIPKYKILFVYDLYNGSYTIWGDDYLDGKNVTLEQIDLYEAKRIVANRIGELIYNQNALNREDKYLIMQWKAKVVLAITSAWLLLNKKYNSSFHEQYNEMVKNKIEIDNFFGNAFFEDYEKSFLFLRENGEKIDILNENLRKYVEKIDILFKNNSLSRSKINNFSRKIKYLIKYFKNNKKYGIINLEDKILQRLIENYITNNSNIIDTANDWKNIIY